MLGILHTLRQGFDKFNLPARGKLCAQAAPGQCGYRNRFGAGGWLMADGLWLMAEGGGERQFLPVLADRPGEDRGPRKRLWAGVWPSR
jgi:hypothetical protein